VADKLPPVAVVALGPAGRTEFSPFCRLQLLLIHGVSDSSLAEPLRLLGRMLHEDFEATGLQLDQVITPRNPEWRGDPIQWQQRLVAGLEQGTPTELINLLRLVDQTALFPGGELENEFSALCLSLLQKSRTTMAFMVSRVMGLSNGLGMMGGFRLERMGPYRGLFALFDYALLPFTASVTALSMIKGDGAAGTRQRIRDLLSRQELNVEAAENLLLAWYNLNELRLSRERELFPVCKDKESLYVNVEAMTDGESELFRETLETVAAIQRNVTITFSGWEEQAAC
jgi:CBS domain-containing protein